MEGRSRQHAASINAEIMKPVGDAFNTAEKVVEVASISANEEVDVIPVEEAAVVEKKVATGAAYLRPGGIVSVIAVLKRLLNARCSLPKPEWSDRQIRRDFVSVPNVQKPSMAEGPTLRSTLQMAPSRNESVARVATLVPQGGPPVAYGGQGGIPPSVHPSTSMYPQQQFVGHETYHMASGAYGQDPYNPHRMPAYQPAALSYGGFDYVSPSAPTPYMHVQPTNPAVPSSHRPHGFEYQNPFYAVGGAQSHQGLPYQMPSGEQVVFPMHMENPANYWGHGPQQVHPNYHVQMGQQLAAPRVQAPYDAYGRPTFVGARPEGAMQPMMPGGAPLPVQHSPRSMTNGVGAGASVGRHLGENPRLQPGGPARNGSVVKTQTHQVKGRLLQTHGNVSSSRRRAFSSGGTTGRSALQLNSPGMKQAVTPVQRIGTDDVSSWCK